MVERDTHIQRKKIKIGNNLNFNPMIEDHLGELSYSIYLYNGMNCAGIMNAVVKTFIT